MATLVDSSIIIAAERGAFDLSDFVNQDRTESYALSAVGAAELFHGLHRARHAAQRVRREAFLDFVLEMMPVLPFDLPDARVFADLWARLANAGGQIAERDLMIAATALTRGYRVATMDARSFPRVPGLKILKL
jgi:tRNA(fMet)-specific endonuclease VapC